MPAFAGDTIGQAAGAYNNWESQNRADVANAINSLMAQKNMATQRAIQANQFSRQMQAEAANRQAQLDMFTKQLGVESERYGNESAWRQRQLDLEERQLKDAEDGGAASPQAQKANAEEFTQASQLVEDPTADVDFTQYKTLTPSQIYSLGTRRKSVLSAAMQQYQSQEDLASMQNELEDLNKKIPAGFDPNKPPPAQYTPTRINPLNWGTPSTPNPDYAQFQATAPLYARRQALTQALTPYAKTIGTFVRVDPTTGRYSPAMVMPAGAQPYAYAPRGVLMPNRGSIAPGMVQQIGPAPLTRPVAGVGPVVTQPSPMIAPARVYRDKSGTRWRYVGTMQDPMKDQDPNNWQQLGATDEE